MKQTEQPTRTPIDTTIIILVPLARFVPTGRPPQAQDRRKAARDRAIDPRAARQADRPRGLRERQPVVVRVRDRGDPARPARARRRRAAFALRRSDHDRAARCPRRPALLVPPDDQGVSASRRRVPRHARQLRRPAGAGRRGRAAHRLHPDGLGVRRRRDRRARPRRSEASSPWRVPISLAFIVDHRVREPARRPGVGRIFAVPTYFFIADDGRAARRGVLPGCSPATSTPTDAAVRRCRRRRRWPASRSCSSSCTPSRRAARPSPASRRSRTASPRSSQPEWKNARTTLMWMGSLLGAMFLGLSILAAHMHVVPDPSEKVDRARAGRQARLRSARRRARRCSRCCRSGRC